MYVKSILIVLLFTQVCFAQNSDKPLRLIADGVQVDYQMLTSASKRWKVCTLLPNARDKYWWGVSQAITHQANLLDLNLAIYDAGSYKNLSKQKRQLKDCINNNAEAFIIAAINSSQLDEEITTLINDGKVVIDLINGIETPNVTAHAVVSFADMVASALEYVADIEDKNEVKVGFLPGPEGVNWVRSAVQGADNFQRNNPNVKMINIGFGATESATQATLIRTFFTENSVDYLVANAVGANIAAKYIKNKKLNTKIISFYTNRDTIASLEQRLIQVTVSDYSIIQAKTAIDLAVKALEKKAHPNILSPVIKALTLKNLEKYDVDNTIGEHQLRLIQKKFTEKYN